MIDPNELHVTTDFQALVTGMLIGFAFREIGKSFNATIGVPEDDENGVHRPYFDLFGAESGTHVRIMVVTVE